MAISEDQLSNWTNPPSDTEDERAENAIAMVKDAINSDDKLKYLDLDIFCQGSYANNTNVRLDSDVDVLEISSKKENTSNNSNMLILITRLLIKLLKGKVELINDKNNESKYSVKIEQTIKGNTSTVQGTNNPNNIGGDVK